MKTPFRFLLKTSACEVSGLLSLLVLFAVDPAHAADGRLRQNLDAGWHFHLGGEPAAKSAAFDDPLQQNKKKP